MRTMRLSLTLLGVSAIIGVAIHAGIFAPAASSPEAGADPQDGALALPVALRSAALRSDEPVATPPTTASSTATSEPRATPTEIPTASRPTPHWNTREVLAAAVLGDHAYVGAGGHVVVVDVRDTGRPTIVAETEELASRCSVTGVHAWGDTLAVLCFRRDASLSDAESKSVVVAIDVGDPASPRVLGRLPIDEMGWSLAAHGPWAYVAGWTGPSPDAPARQGLVVLDLSDPTSPARHGFVELRQVTLDQWSGADRLWTVGQPDGNGGLSYRVVDIATPGAPTLAATLDPVGRGEYLRVVTGLATHAFAAVESGSELLAIETDADGGPALSAILDPGRLGLVRDLATVGDHLVALVDGFDGGLPRIAVLRPPIETGLADGRLEDWLVGEVELPGAVDPRFPVAGMTVADLHVYVPTGDEEGLYIIDVGAPDAPVVVGELGVGG